MIRLDKLLASRGYSSRSRVRDLIKDERVRINGELAARSDQKVDPKLVTIDGEELDPDTGMILVLNKPKGYICSHDDSGQMIYDLLPDRFSLRNPKLASVGRLDKDSRGLLLLTDDGQLIHKLTSPKHEVEKVYKVKLRDELRGDEAQVFGSGTLMIEDDNRPLKPAKFSKNSDGTALVTITEGRYHQVRLMFSALGNEVVDLQRIRIGELELGDLEEGEWRFLEPEEFGLLGIGGSL